MPKYRGESEVDDTLHGLSIEKSRAVRGRWAVKPEDSIKGRIAKRKLLGRSPTAEEKAADKKHRDAILKKKHLKIQKADDERHEGHLQTERVRRVMAKAKLFIKRQEADKKKRELLLMGEESK